MLTSLFFRNRESLKKCWFASSFRIRRVQYDLQNFTGLKTKDRKSCVLRRDVSLKNASVLVEYFE